MSTNTTIARRGVTALVVVNLLLLSSPDGRAGSSGQLDPAFGRAGEVVTAFSGGDSRAFAIATQPKNGAVVAAGESDQKSFSSFALARYRADGALDRHFGLHGERKTVFREGNAAATAVAIQRNGRIIVAGPTGSSTSAQRRIALARYLPDGKLDPSFGSGGKVMTPIQAPTVGEFLGAALALGRNGAIVVAGTGDPNSGPSRFAVARYHANGSLDSSFGDGGELTTSFGSDAAVATALALRRDGRIVVAGYTFEGTTFTLRGFALACYTKNGSPDSTFGSDGKVTTVVGAASAAAAVAVQSDGKVIAAGSTFADKNLKVRHFALVRYGRSGALDPSFGRDGVVTTTFTNDDAIQGIAVSTNGEILAAGSTVSQRGAHYRFALARYKPDGLLDSNFGSGGKVITAFGSGDDQSHAVTTEPNGEIVVAGEASDSKTNMVKFALARYFDRTICQVPRVVSSPIAAAERAIVRASCSVGRIRAEYSPTVSRGHVISQLPSAGARRHRGAKVKLLVSKGKRRRH